MNCKDHIRYASRADAAQALADLVEDAKRTGRGGKSYKRLSVWPCGNHYHVGRSNKLPKNYAKPAPREKPLTVGQALRKLRRLDEAYARATDHYHRRMAELVGKLIEADRVAGWID